MTNGQMYIMREALKRKVAYVNMSYKLKYLVYENSSKDKTMKKLLIGLLAVSSLFSVANECYYGLRYEDGKSTNKIINMEEKMTRILEDKGYSYSDDEDVDLMLSVGNRYLNGFGYQRQQKEKNNFGGHVRNALLIPIRFPITLINPYLRYEFMNEVRSTYEDVVNPLLYGINKESVHSKGKFFRLLKKFPTCEELLSAR